MIVTRSLFPAAIALVVSMSSAIAARAGDEALSRAKDLYLSAAYEDALTVLDTVAIDPGSSDAKEAAEYRVFCLLALQRSSDAQKAIAAIVTDNPFYQPSESQASPRIRAVFRDVRKGLLPVIVQQTYANAKAAFDRNDPRAEAEFDHLLALLDDPDVKGLPATADLRTVAAGFRDLSRAKATAPEPAAKRPSAASAPAAPADSANGSAAVARDIPRTDDTPVVPPVALSQQMPPWTPNRMPDLRREFRGTLAITIDEKGAVTAATVVKSVNPTYDAALLRAAKTWKFKPATRNGVPTTYQKMIEVQLRPTTP